MNVYEKLQHVQSGLKAPKNQYNKFGNYYYRNCEDIQEAAGGALTAKELTSSLIKYASNDTIIRIEEV